MKYYFKGKTTGITEFTPIDPEIFKELMSYKMSKSKPAKLITDIDRATNQFLAHMKALDYNCENN